VQHVLVELLGVLQEGEVTDLGLEGRLVPNRKKYLRRLNGEVYSLREARPFRSEHTSAKMDLEVLKATIGPPFVPGRGMIANTTV
jgi:hypothetical protein